RWRWPLDRVVLQSAAGELLGDADEAPLGASWSVDASLSPWVAEASVQMAVLPDEAAAADGLPTAAVTARLRGGEHATVGALRAQLEAVLGVTHRLFMAHPHPE
ncbi:unnamed protein product, partial [Prorocentrum cordatum]